MDMMSLRSVTKSYLRVAQGDHRFVDFLSGQALNTSNKMLDMIFWEYPQFVIVSNATY